MKLNELSKIADSALKRVMDSDDYDTLLDKLAEMDIPVTGFDKENSSVSFEVSEDNSSEIEEFLRDFNYDDEPTANGVRYTVYVSQSVVDSMLD